ncbi:TetR/AcrR family transcriptional regulator [Streptomyces sp. N2-109]|uniref:TetR/AcrR family transcriptional regulator n=1 Tax=Streptomyces gossypii TaxID=2883101 RepID=A0ABT2JQL6_9ACTN|nr:TetR/AcrR family transcriptional regulator [Streptomyces gossypii]MCT2590175.1 TetR/AcrR family transcriptional regulator [Streptomyces gossypii]
MTAPQDGTAVARRQRTDARRNRERLVEAAREAYAEAGPEASLNEIARRAGVGPGTLYRHFPTRTELLTAVLRNRIETLCTRAVTLQEAAAAAAVHTAADDALAEWLRAFLAHARVNQGLGGALMLEEPAALGIDCHQLILDAAAGMLTLAQRQGTARTDVSPADLLRLVTGIALSTARGDDLEEPDRLLGLVLDAVRRPDRRA